MGEKKMKSMFIRLGLTALFMSALAGCGGGGDGTPAATPTTPTTPTAGNPPVTVTPSALPQGATVASVNAMTPAQFASTTFKGEILSVTVNSPPVVTFRITDGAGNTVTGLGRTSINSTTATVPALTNLAFNFAKLVPNATGPGSPSRWVNLLTWAAPAKAAATTDATTGAAVAAGTAIPIVLRRPNTDNQGTLVDNGDGTYKYTFYRDVTKAQDIVNDPQVLADTKTLANRARKNSADAVSAKDLCGDPSAASGSPNYGWSCAWEPTKVHRLAIFVVGNAPGTGTNTPDACNAPLVRDAAGVCQGDASKSVAAVALKTPTNIFIDFIPATGKLADAADQRNIVKVDACLSCHFKITGIHGGSFLTGVGGTRQDTRMCVMCHTEQAKFGSFDPAAWDNLTVANSKGPVTYASNGTTITGPDYLGDGVQKYNDGSGSRAMVYFPAWMHRIHQGENLVKTGYDVLGIPGAAPAAGMGINEIRFPQDRRNCLKCHIGGTATETPQKDNWKNVPNRAACGACHDGINFATGGGIRQGDRAISNGAGAAPVGPATASASASGHGGGPMGDDSLCSTCHKANGVDIEILHRTDTATTSNPTAMANRPTIAYTLNSLTINASGQPVFKFKITKDGVDVTSFNTPTLVRNATSGRMQVATTYEPITGFAGGPSLYVAQAMPVDGITDPADFTGTALTASSLANLLVTSGSPKTGTLTVDSSGVWTATITGDLVGQPADAGCVAAVAPAVATCNPTALAASPITIPATSKQVSGAIMGTFTQKTVPTTMTPGRYSNYVPQNVLVNPAVAATGGLAVKSLLVKKAATGYKERRVIVAKANCEKCHDQLGTAPDFHGGARNDPTVCNFCHNTARVNRGYSLNSNTFYHAIHSARKRAEAGGVPFNAMLANLTWDTMVYPGVLRNCQQCHLANTVNYGNNAALDNTSAIYAVSNGNLPYLTAAAGGANANSTTSSATLGGVSPWIVNGTNYGTADAFTAATGTVTPGAATQLFNSPIANACLGCHTTNMAMNHMRTNGGYLYATRAQIGYNDGGTVQTATNRINYREGCLACHGMGKPFDVETIHMSTVQ